MVYTYDIVCEICVTKLGEAKFQQELGAQEQYDRCRVGYLCVNQACHAAYKVEHPDHGCDGCGE